MLSLRFRLYNDILGLLIYRIVKIRLFLTRGLPECANVLGVRKNIIKKLIKTDSFHKKTRGEELKGNSIRLKLKCILVGTPVWH